MNIFRTTLIAISLVLVAACGTTPPSNYYVLNTVETKIPSGQSPSLVVGPIVIPQYLNRNSLVYHRNDNQLHIATYERWAEPLDDGVERVLSLNLASLLNTENVQTFPWHRSQKPDYAVEVTILALDVDENNASLVAEWLAFKPKAGGIVTRRISRLHQALPDDYTAAQMAPAYSALLNQLSHVIAAAIAADQAGNSEQEE